MLQPRERTGRAGRDPGRGGEPRELPVRSRDAAAVYPHRTAPWLQLREWGTPGHLSAPGFQGRSRPRTRVSAGLRVAGGPGRPETRGASRIPRGFPHPGEGWFSHPGGGSRSRHPRRRRNRGRIALRAATGTAPGTGQRPEPAVSSCPWDPAPAPHRHRETALPPAHTGDGSTGERAAPSRRTRTAAAPGERRRETSAGANLPCAAAERGAVRCGTGAGRVRALRQHRPLRARVQRLRVAPPTAHKPRLLPRKATPLSAARPAPSAVLGAGSPQRSAGLRAGSRQTPPTPELRLCRVQPGALRAAPRGRGGQKGWGHLGSVGWWCTVPDDVTVVSAAVPQWCCCSYGAMMYLCMVPLYL